MMLRRNHKNRNKAGRSRREQIAAVYGLPKSQGSPGVLKMIRQAANLTIAEAAMENAMSAAAWERMEVGMTPIPIDLIDSVCKRYNLDMNLRDARFYDELGSHQKDRACLLYHNEPPYDSFLYFLDSDEHLYARQRIKEGLS